MGPEQRHTGFHPQWRLLQQLLSRSVPQTTRLRVDRCLGQTAQALTAEGSAPSASGVGGAAAAAVASGGEGAAWPLAVEAVEACDTWPLASGRWGSAAGGGANATWVQRQGHGSEDA